MAISSSTDRREKCVAGAFVFSGRPDPTWEVKPAFVKELQRIWRTLKPEKVEISEPPSLGYRGCFLKCSAKRRWTAFDGVVVFKTEKRSESRRDTAKRFERAILASAPTGALPPWSAESRFPS
jgi:hypothetical protein